MHPPLASADARRPRLGGRRATGLAGLDVAQCDTWSAALGELPGAPATRGSGSVALEPDWPSGESGDDERARDMTTARPLAPRLIAGADGDGERTRLPPAGACTGDRGAGAPPADALRLLAADRCAPDARWVSTAVMSARRACAETALDTAPPPTPFLTPPAPADPAERVPEGGMGAAVAVWPAPRTRPTASADGAR